MSALDDLKAKEELTGLEFAVYMLAITGTGEPEEAAADLAAKDAAIEAAREAIDLALNWGPKTQSDEHLIETRLQEALAKLEGAK